MGHVPILHPASIPLDAHVAELEPRIRRRRSRLGWRRRSAYRACARLIVLREHDLYGLHEVDHAGACGRGRGRCGPRPPLKPSEPTYRLR